MSQVVTPVDGREAAVSVVPPPPSTPPPSTPSTPSTTAQLTLMLQQALAKGDLIKSLESMSSLLSLSGDNRLKHDLLLKLIDLTKHFESLAVSAPNQSIPLLKCLRLLLVDKEPTLRSQSLRVMRYLITDWEMVHQMLEINMDLLIVRSLERESKYLWERMQALKFVRKWMNMLSMAQQNKAQGTPTPHSQRGPVGLTRSVVQSLVAIAEQPKDDFRRVCLDAIRELTLLSPGIVASCNGIRTLVDSILDPACVDIANSLTLTLLYLIDSEATRGFLRPSVDLVRLISVFTDTSAADNPERENRRAAAHKALVMLMRSWTGILVLTSDPQCLRALIGMLNLPPSIKGSSWARETIFDLLFEVVHVVKASDVRAVGARIRTSMAASAASNTASSSVCHAYPPNLLHSYMVMLLLSFLACDLVDILTQLALSSDAEFSVVACKLLGEILGLGAELLPKEVNQKLHSMRGVIALAANFDSADGSAGAVNDLALHDTGAQISSRVRAVNVLSSLAHSELNFMGANTGNAFGIGNASIVSQNAPGTGWGWTGALGVNWEAVAHASALQQAAMNRDRRDSHDWNGSGSGGTGSLMRNSSFSGGRGGAGMTGGSSDNFNSNGIEHTPTGRRAILHGIRIERLAFRADYCSNPAKLINSLSYGGSAASNSDVLAPAVGPLSSQTLAARNRMRHRLGAFLRAESYLTSHGGMYQSLPLTPLAEFAKEENELAPYLKKSNVLNTKEYRSWDWEYIYLIIERFMLHSVSHTAYLVSKTKFPKRLLSFLRSDKKHFVEIDWQPFHLKFVRTGAMLIKAMLGCSEAREYTWFIELIDGIFLAVLWEMAATENRKDIPHSGGTGFQHSTPSSGGATTPALAGAAPAPSPTASAAGGMEPTSSYLAARRLSHLSNGLLKSKAKIFACFTRSGCTTKLFREYFIFLGILSTCPHGLSYFDKFGFYETLTNLARDPSKDYLTKQLIANLNFWNGPGASPAVATKSLRKILEGWLAIPAQGKEGCSTYLRLWTIDHLLIWWRRHQSQLGSQQTSMEADMTSPGALLSLPTSTAPQVVNQANTRMASSVQSSQGDAFDGSSWAVNMLLQQLNCLDLHVRAAALDAIEEIVMADPIALHALVSRRPPILRELASMSLPASSAAAGGVSSASVGQQQQQALFPAAQRLLVLFLSSKSGLEYLRQSGLGGESWLDQQMAEWEHKAGSNTGGCTTYVRGLEEALVAALSSSNKDDTTEHLEEGLSAANTGSPAPQGAPHKLDELNAPPAPPSVASSAWSGPPIRSALDEALFERIHALPFCVDITMENQGRSVQLMTECWVVTTSHAPPGATTTTASSPPSPQHLSRAPSNSEDLGSGVSLATPAVEAMPVGTPQTYLVCQLLDLEGFPRPVKVEGNVVLRARLSVGAGPHSQNVADMTAAGTAAAGSPPTPSNSSRTMAYGSYGTSSRNGGGGFNTYSDTTATFQDDKDPERDWSRVYFPDSSGHASEYICRGRDRERVTAEHPFVSTTNASELCTEDEARWHFEVPDPLVAPFTHNSVRGHTVGSSPPGAITLESVWFPLPLPSSQIPSVSLLPHLYGELSRTEDGAALIAQSGQIKELEKSIRGDGGLAGHVPTTDDSVNGFISMPTPASALEKRSALWAVGFIGSTNVGFQLLTQQAPGLVQYISQQAVCCTTLSMRGTCFYVLGLLGRSTVGRTFLSALGWGFSPFPGGCIAIPSEINYGDTSIAAANDEENNKRMAELEQDDEEEIEEVAPGSIRAISLSRSQTVINTAQSTAIVPAHGVNVPLSEFLHLSWPAASYRGSWATDPANVYGINSSKRTRKVGGVEGAANEEKQAGAGGSTTKDDSNEVLSSSEGIEVILSHLSNLCNHVTQKNSLQALRTMKAQPQHAHFFTSPLLLFETFKLIACYSYKLPARRFLFFDLFGGVAFNMHTIAQFDQNFHEQNVSSYSMQKLKAAREQASKEITAAHSP